MLSSEWPSLGLLLALPPTCYLFHTSVKSVATFLLPNMFLCSSPAFEITPNVEAMLLMSAKRSITASSFRSNSAVSEWSVVLNLGATDCPLARKLLTLYLFVPVYTFPCPHHTLFLSRASVSCLCTFHSLFCLSVAPRVLRNLPCLPSARLALRNPFYSSLQQSDIREKSGCSERRAGICTYSWN